MNKSLSVVLSIFLLFQGCSFLASSNQPSVLDFLTKSDLLKDGIVHKYYIHFDDHDKYSEVASHVEYRSYQSADQKRLISNIYDPAFSMTRHLEFEVTEDKLKAISDIRYLPIRNDTIENDVLSPIYLDLKDAEQSYKTSSRKRISFRKQLGLKDTTILNYPGIIVEGKYITTSFMDSDTVIVEEPYREIYLKGFGLFATYFFTEEGTYHRELVEQIHLKDFLKRADHKIERIGFIKEEDALVKDENFQPCGDFIYNYYNDQVSEVYVGGKYEFKKAVFPLIDSSLLYQESGYLTFRFVVNCKRQIGRLVTEMADLAYNDKVFNKNTIDHLAGVLMKLDAWKGNTIRGKEVDAFTYITFKLKDGEIIEILP